MAATYQQAWNDDAAEIVRKLVETKFTATEIAAELGAKGYAYSRNAVIGKINRLGLKLFRAQGVVNTPKIKRAGDDARRLTQTLRKIKPGQNPSFGPEIKPLIEPEGPSECAVSLLELTSENCHWPIGDPHHPDFHFCGRSALEGRPYCAHHCRISYTPQDQRRRQPQPGASR